MIGFLGGGLTVLTLFSYVAQPAIADSTLAAVADCPLPAISRADQAVTPNAAGLVPCDGLPDGIVLICADSQRRLHVADCPRVIVLSARP